MIVTTTNDVTGYRVTKHLGVVRGITVRSRSVIGNIGAGLQSIFGGNISIYTNLAEKAREEAFELMVQHAQAAGANAILAMRYDANEISDGITEVLAYGTAVVVQPRAERAACQSGRVDAKPARLQECSSTGRAPVSKTGGCRFEPCHSCQPFQAFLIRTKPVRGLSWTQLGPNLDPTWTQRADACAARSNDRCILNLWRPYLGRRWARSIPKPCR